MDLHERVRRLEDADTKTGCVVSLLVVFVFFMLLVFFANGFFDLNKWCRPYWAEAKTLRDTVAVLARKPGCGRLIAWPLTENEP